MRSLFALFLATISVSATAAGADPLVNPGFDNDLSGWHVNDPTVWDPRDVAGSGSSGSALLTYDFLSGGGTLTGGLQCLNVEPGAYLYGAMAYVPVGEPEVTAGRIMIYTYSGEDCSGDLVQFVVSPANTEQGIWTATGSNIDIITENSVEVRLGVIKGSGVSEPGSVHLDNIHFNPDEVFHDRFEASF